jgi:glutamyl-tRNA reductase
MGVAIVGLSYKTAPVAIRERIAFTKEEIPPALRKLVSSEGISSAMILSTCNRVELLVEAADEIGAIHTIRKFLHEYHKIDGGEIDSFLYEMTGVAAIRHIFRVASGLDSMVLGECQILGQLKDAYSYSVQSECISGILNQLIIETFRAAKHVRALTSISMAGRSVSRAAVEFAKDVFGDLTQRTILVVGAGKMSELTTLHLCRTGAVKVLVTNRTYDRAAALAARFQGTAVHFQELSSTLFQADIVITSVSGSADYVSAVRL